MKKEFEEHRTNVLLVHYIFLYIQFSVWFHLCFVLWCRCSYIF